MLSRFVMYLGWIEAWFMIADMPAERACRRREFTSQVIDRPVPHCERLSATNVGGLRAMSWR